MTLTDKEKLKAIQERIDAIHMDDYEFCVGEIQKILGGKIPKNFEKIEEALEFIERILKSNPNQLGTAEESLLVKVDQFKIIKKILES